MTDTPRKITVHMAFTYPDMDVGVEEIRRWHVDGNGWSDIGYHWVVRRDGTVEEGRPMFEQGAHVKGHNRNNIGVCLVGGKSRQTDEAEFNFTRSQMRALEELILELIRKRGGLEVEVYGHDDFAPGRGCPGYNVEAWWYEGRER